MADNIRVEPTHGDVAPTGANVTHDRTIVETETLIPAHPDRAATAAATNDPEIARAEIEHTRARMSDTIDEIEDVLVRQKERIQDRLDVLAPVREHALPAAGAALGAGLLLGLLTGGDDDDEDDYDLEVEGGYGYGDRARHHARRADLWENRARRLLSIARDQEEEIEELRGEHRGGWRDAVEDYDGYDYDDEDGEETIFDRFSDLAVRAVTGYVRGALRDYRGCVRTGTVGRVRTCSRAARAYSFRAVHPHPDTDGDALLGAARRAGPGGGAAPAPPARALRDRGRRAVARLAARRGRRDRPRRAAARRGRAARRRGRRRAVALTVTPRGLAATLLVVLVAAVCVRLGFWQLDRLEQRRAANAEVAGAMRLPPYPLDAATLGEVAADPARVAGRRVTLRGTYLTDAEVVLRGRALGGRPGVNLVTPMRVEGTPYVALVNRGWAPSPDARTVDVAALREVGMHEVVGLVQPLSPDDAPNAVLVSPDGGGRSVQRVTRAEMQPRVDGPLLPFVVTQLPEPPREEPPLRLAAPPQSEGNHLAYAIQWFSFAAIALVGWAVMAYRATRPPDSAPQRFRPPA